MVFLDNAVIIMGFFYSPKWQIYSHYWFPISLWTNQCQTVHIGSAILVAQTTQVSFLSNNCNICSDISKWNDKKRYLPSNVFLPDSKSSNNSSYVNTRSTIVLSNFGGPMKTFYEDFDSLITNFVSAGMALT